MAKIKLTLLNVQVVLVAPESSGIMMKILFVEDDNLLVTELMETISKYNYECVAATNFADIMQDFNQEQPDLVILDVNLPYHDGFHWCREIRKEHQTPIIMLSSRDTKLDQLTGMTIGADDYLTKPVDIDLLTIKIQTLLRRSYDYNTISPNAILTVGDLKLNTQNFILQFHEQTEELTKNETKILQMLFENKDTFVRRDLIIDYLWENESYIDENTLNVNVSRVRKKIVDLTNKEYIETKRLVGYKITDVE